MLVNLNPKSFAFISLFLKFVHFQCEHPGEEQLATNLFLRFSKSEFTAAWTSRKESPEAVRFVLSASKQDFV